jgi:hypothetical protein
MSQYNRIHELHHQIFNRKKVQPPTLLSQSISIYCHLTIPFNFRKVLSVVEKEMTEERRTKRRWIDVRGEQEESEGGGVIYR